MQVSISGPALQRFASAPHQGSIADRDGLVFCEGSSAIPDWQLVRFDFKLPVLDLASVEMVLDRTEQPNLLSIMLSGGQQIAFVDLGNGLIDNVSALNVECNIVNNRQCHITLKYDSHDGLLFIGLSNESKTSYYAGNGVASITIRSLSYSSHYRAGSRVPLVVLDVGAAGGIEPELDSFREDVSFILVEPDPNAAKVLRDCVKALPDCTVLEAGLAGSNGSRTLYITAAPACSSLLRPNIGVLDRYAVAPLFAISNTVEVECYRYDELINRGLKTPDYIKLDTQGTELEILMGFGELLNECIAVQVEAHFYEIYTGQSLLSDIVKYLDGFEMALRDVRPCRSFDSEYVEVDAFFVKRSSCKTSERVAEKIALIEEVFCLQRFDNGLQLLNRVFPSK